MAQEDSPKLSVEGGQAPAKIQPAQERGGVDPLVSQAIEGDEDAFSKLYKTHFRRVFAICLNMVKNPETAEDLTQEVFMKLPEKIKSFKGEAAFTTWLHRVAINEALMYLRRISRKTKGTENKIIAGQEVMDNLMENATGSTRFGQEENEIVKKIGRERAVKKLPPGQKAVYLLSEEGYSQEESADKLGKDIGTVKSQLSKAKKRLRKLLS